MDNEGGGNSSTSTNCSHGGAFFQRRRGSMGGVNPPPPTMKRRNSLGNNGTYQAFMSSTTTTTTSSSIPKNQQQQQLFQQQQLYQQQQKQQQRHQPMRRRNSMDHYNFVPNPEAEAEAAQPVSHTSSDGIDNQAQGVATTAQESFHNQNNKTKKTFLENTKPEEEIDTDHKPDDHSLEEKTKEGNNDSPSPPPQPIVTFENPTQILLEKLQKAVEVQDIVHYMEEVGDAARDPETRKELGRSKISWKDGITIVLQIMANCKGNQEIQEMACRAISNLACGNLLNQETIVSKNGLWLIFQAMNRFDDAASLQHKACYALGNLALNNPSNQKSIVDKGGLAMIASAMRRFPQDAQVQHRACFAFAKLGRDQQEIQLRIRYQEGILELLESARKQHPDNSRVQKLAKTVLSMSKDAMRRPMRRSLTR
mmetsp:Transcript_24222/g.34675  ORF Transcript_24222/g.34675 Transcript_24222/m.34675 type:complete len:424 (+) Transcript_24222:101-1372(+)